MNLIGKLPVTVQQVGYVVSLLVVLQDSSVPWARAVMTLQFAAVRLEA